MHSTVSSPATVPIRAAKPVRSIARATALACPGGVFTTARFWVTRVSLTKILRSRSCRLRSNASTAGVGSSYQLVPSAPERLATPRLRRSLDSVACVTSMPPRASASASSS